MKRKEVSIQWVMVVCLLLAMQACAENPYKRRFLRPLFRQSSQLSGRSEAAETGRGLLKHFLSFRNLFQQPQSNVIIITRPADPTDDTTTTTGITRMPHPDDFLNDDDNDDLVEDSPLIYNGINDKISRESTEIKNNDQVTRKKKNNNNKRRRKLKTRHHQESESDPDNEEEREDNIRHRKRLRKTTGKSKSNLNRAQNEEFFRMIDSIRQRSSKD